MFNHVLSIISLACVRFLEKRFLSFSPEITCHPAAAAFSVTRPVHCNRVNSLQAKHIHRIHLTQGKLKKIKYHAFEVYKLKPHERFVCGCTWLTLESLEENDWTMCASRLWRRKKTKKKKKINKSYTCVRIQLTSWPVNWRAALSHTNCESD